MAKVACIGECMVELRHVGPHQLEQGFGGDTLNTAVYLARLGRPAGLAVSYVTALGDDAYSDAMVAAWQAEGIDTSLVARLPGRLPGLYTIRTDAQGERSFTYWRTAAAARDLLRAGGAERLAQALAGYELVYLSGITLSILDPPQRAQLLQLCRDLRAHGSKIAFDGNYRPAGWSDPAVARAACAEMLASTDIALPTLDDERALHGDPDAAACAARLHGLGVPEIAIKQGAADAYLSSPAGTCTVPAPPVAQVIDSTAAGDSFNAAYLAARLAGAAPEEAARQGHALAGRVIGYRGAIMPAAAMADLIAQPR